MLKTQPFIKLLIPFAGAIIFALSFDLKFDPVWLIIAGAALLATSFWLIKNSLGSLVIPLFYGVVVFFFLFIIGWTITQTYSDTNKANYFTQVTKAGSKIILQINEPLSEKQKVFKTIAKVKYILDGDSLKETKGNVLLYFQKNDSVTILKYGDLVYTEAKFDTLASPKNPDEFNYKQYLNDHNIYKSIYLKVDTWENLHNNTGNIFLSIAYSLRSYCINLFDKYIPNTNGENGVVSALVLGYRDNLDSDIEHSFADIGVIHIIAVAGLHVGLIYSLLIFSLRFLPSNRTGNLIRIGVSLIVIWLFALITGLPGSVLRAGTMFSFIVIGKYSGKSYNTLNLLAASAFLLLLIDPFLLKDVGFQLSFTAVAGILYLYPKLYAFIVIENKLLDKIWSMVCLSITAQAATLPLILYYYNQFPAYFIISNIIVVPLAALILYLSVALIVLGKIQLIASILGWLIYHLTMLMDFITVKISHLPLAVFTFSAFNTMEVILLFALLALVILFLQQKTYSILQILVLTSIVYFLFISIDKIRLSRQQEVYHLQFPKKQVAEILSSDTATLYATEDLSTDKDLYNYYFKQHWRRRGIKEVHWVIEK